MTLGRISDSIYPMIVHQVVPYAIGTLERIHYATKYILPNAINYIASMSLNMNGLEPMIIFGFI